MPFITSLFVSVNFYAEKPSGRISDFTLVYLNSWEEMFLRTVRLKVPAADLEPVKKQICMALGLKQLPPKRPFFTSQEGLFNDGLILFAILMSFVKVIYYFKGLFRGVNE